MPKAALEIRCPISRLYPPTRAAFFLSLFVFVIGCQIEIAIHSPASLGRPSSESTDAHRHHAPTHRCRVQDGRRDYSARPPVLGAAARAWPRTHPRRMFPSPLQASSLVHYSLAPQAHNAGFARPRQRGSESAAVQVFLVFPMLVAGSLHLGCVPRVSLFHVSFSCSVLGSSIVLLRGDRLAWIAQLTCHEHAVGGAGGSLPDVPQSPSPEPRATHLTRS